MKLLFDENLSPDLVDRLSDVFPDSTHVHFLGLGSEEDELVWEHAKDHGFAIVSKDADFHQRSLVIGHPPKLVWIQRGNCPTREIEELLRSVHEDLERFERGDEAFLVLE